MGHGWAGFLTAAFVCLACIVSPVRSHGGQAVVAIHDSELTRALETITASNATPTGAGTTGFEWWTTNWHYFTMPEALKEMLRSDGTSFAVVSDADITAGSLLDSNGLPKYPIVISLAAEAMRNDQIAPLTNYVAAGGFLFVGSSSFTRNTNGTTRTNFALAAEMGINMVNGALTNWLPNRTFTAESSHRLISHIPQGTLTWQMPSAADEISWPKEVHEPNPPTNLLHLTWQVRAAGATILAQGDSRPYLLVKQYGKGWFIYEAAMQPVIGHGGWAPGMYAYGIFRNAIEWAFQTAKTPVPRVSAWPYQYNAAVIFRHDMEAIDSLINSINASAGFEFTNGAKGDYYFCTGQLRVNMNNNATTIANLQAAVSNFNATISSHNGGFSNIATYVPALGTNDYDYWHWGTDEVLDLSPPGFSNGVHYALVSLSNSFNDIQGWGLSNSVRHWVAPYFNATRESSFQIQEQLGVKIVGEQKIGPFPHWTLSTQTSGKLYSFLTLPVSDWFVNARIGQAMENGYTIDSMRALVDYYYSLGALVNLYSHSSSASGGVASDYVTYSVGRPAMWSANSIDIYNWWLTRSNVQVAPVFTTNSTQSIITLTISGATDTNTAVEVFVPSAAYYGLQVLTNGVAAGTNRYRTVGQTVRVLAGTTVTNAQIIYSLPPVALDDVYTMQQGGTLSPGAPGVLGNDLPGSTGTNLAATLVSNVTQGTLTLLTNGNFTNTPASIFTGVDRFTYTAGDGQTNSAPATAAIVVTPPGALFYDEFSRPTSSTSLLPWVSQLGTWSITNGAMTSASVSNSYGNAYYQDASWTNYVVQARVRFSTASALGGGVGGRLDPKTGAHYGAWVYPESSPSGNKVLKLVKFRSWTTWSLTPITTAVLPSVGTDWHTVTMSLVSSNITIYFDGAQVINVTDNSFDSIPPYLSGGISADMFTFNPPYTRTIDDVIVVTTNAPLIMRHPTDQTTAPGTTATFTVAALGPSLNYQWLKGTNAISGATNASFSITNVQNPDLASYSVIVSNVTASVTSSNAALIFTDPAITVPPLSRTNDAGTTATFSVTAAGTGTLNYRWHRNGVALNNGGKISGVTTTNLTITNVLGADAGNYTVVVTNNFGAATNSPPAVLTVIDPIITSLPVSRTNLAGTTATFTVAAYGTTTLSYFWFKDGIPLTNGGNISGATTTTLTITNVLGADQGGYTVTVSNSVGIAASSPPAVLTVIDPIILAHPVSRTNHAGTSASFTVTAFGTAPQFQWIKGIVPVGGATNPTYTIPSVVPGDAGSYSVTVSNAFGTTNSGSASLTVVDVPVIQSIVVSNNIASVTWTSFAGQGYRLQYKDDLLNTNWLNATPDFVASGSLATGTNGISGSTNRFYRVFVLP